MRRDMEDTINGTSIDKNCNTRNESFIEWDYEQNGYCKGKASELENTAIEYVKNEERENPI